jgi:redox-sensitive bicupin YhaK (pirin superfamily)
MGRSKVKEERNTIMMTVRRSDERGHAEHGWLDSYHTFSFADYYDTEHMNFRALRVLNEDRIAPGQGFGTHPHDNMEILTYVIDGELEHQDSMGHREVIHAGEFQSMTAGTGITHSEYNASANKPVHLVQIWIKPDQRGLTPGYAQRIFPTAEKKNRLRLIAAKNAKDGALKINQDTRVYLAAIEPGASLEHKLESGRHAWIQVLSGTLSINGVTLKAGDGVQLSDEPKVTIQGLEKGEILFFDLA